MHRLVMALALSMVLGSACSSGSSEPEPSPTTTRPPATSAPTLAELERSLILVSVPCREIFISGVYSTFEEGPEPLTADDVRSGVMAKYEVVCTTEPTGVASVDAAYPSVFFLKVSEFESAEAASESIKSVEGEINGTTYANSGDPLLGHKSSAIRRSGSDGSYSETVSAALFNMGVTVETSRVDDSGGIARDIAVDAVKRAIENAAEAAIEG